MPHPTPYAPHDLPHIPEYTPVFYVFDGDIFPVERIDRDFVSDVDHIKAPVTDTRFIGTVYATYTEADASRTTSNPQPKPMSAADIDAVPDGHIIYARHAGSTFASPLQRDGDVFRIVGTSSSYAVTDVCQKTDVYASEADATESYDARLSHESDAAIIQMLFDGWVAHQVENDMDDDAFIAMQQALRTRFGTHVEMPDTDAIIDAIRDREYD